MDSTVQECSGGGRKRAQIRIPARVWLAETSAEPPHTFERSILDTRRKMRLELKISLEALANHHPGFLA